MSSSSIPFTNAEERVEKLSFDEDFTTDISKKMTVPNKIKAVEGGAIYNNPLDDPAILAMYGTKENQKLMNVPECIRVGGGDSHIVSVREPPPEIKLEDQLFGKPNDLSTILQLSTPPRTLRYQDAEPIFAEPIKQLDQALNQSNLLNNSNLNNLKSFSNILDSTTSIKQSNKQFNNNETSLMDLEDLEPSAQNLIQLRRRILQLSHRIESIEIENRHRNKRDLILYALGAIYLLFRGLSWFASLTGGGGRNRFTF